MISFIDGIQINCGVKLDKEIESDHTDNKRNRIWYCKLNRKFTETFRVQMKII
jgi:hypothetical protein